MSAMHCETPQISTKVANGAENVHGGGVNRSYFLCFGVFCAVLTSAFAADTDENGLSPYYWNRFDGSHSTVSGQAKEPMNWTGNSSGGYYVESRSGKASHLGYESYSSGEFALGDGGWTIVETVRLPFAFSKEISIFAAGSGAYDGVGVVLTGENEVKLRAFSDGTGAKNTATTSAYSDAVQVPGIKERFHNFALVVDGTGDATTASLYVDGVFKISLKCPFDRVPAKRYFQHGSVYDGGSLVTTSRLNEYDDFRLYQQALTAEQAAKIAAAFAPWPEDEIGSWPEYWFKFDGSLDQCGLRTISMTQQNGTSVSYADSCGGQAETGYSAWSAANGFHASGGDGNFTVSITAKTPSEAKKVVWSVGYCNGFSNGYKAKPLFLATTDTGVAVLNVPSNKASANYTASDVVTLLSVDVPDAATHFHDYAITVDHAGGELRLFVDGVKHTAKYSDEPFTDYPMQFGSIYSGGGLEKSVGYKIGADAVIDDFRSYPRLLSDAEIAKIADTFPVWPEADALGGLPRYWMRFNGSLRQSGELTAKFNGSAAHQGAFVADGADKSGASASGLKSVKGFVDYTPNNAASFLDLGGTSWTLMATAKVEEDAQGRAVVFCIGRSTDSTHGCAFVAVDGKYATLKRYVGGGAAATVLAKKRVGDAEEAFHNYAVVCEGGEKLSFYIDGTKFGEGAVSLDATALPFQPGAVFSNAQNSGYRDVVGYGNVLDDWRLYGRALSEEEIAKISLDEFGLRHLFRGLTVIIR